MKESGIGWTRLLREINVAGVDKFLHDSHGLGSVHRVWGEEHRSEGDEGREGGRFYQDSPQRAAWTAALALVSLRGGGLGLYIHHSHKH